MSKSKMFDAVCDDSWKSFDKLRLIQDNTN